MSAASVAIGQRLLAARRAARMNRPELARLCGIEAHTIRDIERGQQRMSVDLLAPLAAALSIDAGVLAGFDSRGSVSHSLDRAALTTCIAAALSSPAAGLSPAALAEHIATIYDIQLRSQRA